MYSKIDFVLAYARNNSCYSVSQAESKELRLRGAHEVRQPVVRTECARRMIVPPILAQRPAVGIERVDDAVLGFGRSPTTSRWTSASVLLRKLCAIPVPAGNPTASPGLSRWRCPSSQTSGSPSMT